MRQFEAGELIFKAGENGDTLAVIASGSVRIEKPRADGTVIPLARLHEGEFFGEMALLGDGLRTANVVAESELEILEVSRKDLNKVVKARDEYRKNKGK